MRFDLPDMGEAPSADAPVDGVPKLLPLEHVDEDPDQPRKEFDAESLNELAATIAIRGVRQPVSVRAHPSQPGRWMLNFGARRLRASKLAGRTEIPAFVETPFDSYDQVIENEQREPLKPLELALFMQRRLIAGDTRAEIARGLGKSRGYLTFVGALIDAPEWLLDLYRSGRCTGTNELYDLRKLHESHRLAVEQWSRELGSISREDVHRLKDVLSAKSAAADTPRSRMADRSPAEEAGSDLAEKFVSLSAPPAFELARPSKTTGGIVLWASYRGTDVTIDLRSVPAEDGFVFVRQALSGEAVCVSAIDLQLVRVTAPRH